MTTSRAGDLRQMGSLARTFVKITQLTHLISDSVRHLPFQKGARSLALVSRCMPSAVLRVLTGQIIPLISYLFQYRQSPGLPLAWPTCYRMALTLWSCSPPGVLLVQSKRHRTQLPHLGPPHLSISGPSSTKLPLLGAYRDISHTTLPILERETSYHSLYSLQCVGLLLILLVMYLARESSTIYLFFPIIKKTVSRRTFGLPLTTNGITPISVRELPCA